MNASWGLHLWNMFHNSIDPFNEARLTAESYSSGWPDLSIGWRYQIPVLLELGYRVVVPDILGFGRSDAPQINQPSDMAYYGFKRAADDIKELARQLGSETIILGGHDWVSPASPDDRKMPLGLTGSGGKNPGRSHRLQNRTVAPRTRFAPLRRLHTLLGPQQDIRAPRTPREDPHAELGLPTPPRERRGRTARQVQRRDQTIPQLRVRRHETERGGRLQRHGGAAVRESSKVGQDAVDGGGRAGVLRGGV